jgi:hypothetical protein
MSESERLELIKRCNDLGIPPLPEISIHVKVQNPDGSLALERTMPGNSWVRNFYNWVFTQMTGTLYAGASFGAGYMILKDTGGTLRGSGDVVGMSGADPPQYATMGLRAAEGVLTGGIVLGTSETEVTINDYNLGTAIAHGSGSGQLYYYASTIGSNVWDSDLKVWRQTLSRICINNSGGTITVKEASLRFHRVVAASFSAMMERTVLSPSVPVLDGQVLTVTYTLSISFSWEA